MKRALMLCALLMLAACNRVETSEPMFAAAEADGAPALRDGVWIIDDGAPLSAFEVMASDYKRWPCRFDERRPVRRWPKCARVLLIDQGRVLLLVPEQGKPEWVSQPFVLTGGAPRVLQIQQFDPVLFADEAREHGEELPEPAYSYFGVESLRTDPEGRVIAIEAWPALCGPYPENDGAKRVEDMSGYLTPQLLPGMAAEGAQCTTTSRDAVLESVRRSRGWEDEPVRAHWVRDRRD